MQKKKNKLKGGSQGDVALKKASDMVRKSYLLGTCYIPYIVLSHFISTYILMLHNNSISQVLVTSYLKTSKQKFTLLSKFPKVIQLVNIKSRTDIKYVLSYTHSYMTKKTKVYLVRLSKFPKVIPLENIKSGTDIRSILLYNLPGMTGSQKTSLLVLILSLNCLDIDKSM